MNATRIAPFVNFGLSRDHVCNGINYGAVGNTLVRRSKGPGSLEFSGITAAVVVYPSVRARAVILGTLGRAGDFDVGSSGMCLLNRGKGRLLILGGRWSVCVQVSVNQPIFSWAEGRTSYVCNVVLKY